MNDVEIGLLISVLCSLQIAGTSKNFQKKRHSPEMNRRLAGSASDSDESYSNGSRGRPVSGGGNKFQSFSPSTPPPTVVNYRTAKRRKGIPHRAPMGGLIIQY